MAGESEPPSDAFLGDPLGETTRKERRTLLGVSIAAIAMAWTGAIPTEISSVGIKFNPADKVALLKILAVVVGYFVIAFSAYAWADFFRWWLSILHASETDAVGAQAVPLDSTAAGIKAHYVALARRVRRAAIPAALLRAAIDFLLPIVAGCYAIWRISRAWQAVTGGSPPGV